MTALKALQFVRGAVSSKGLGPGMNHFVIKAGTVRATNGILTLSSPIDFDVDCAPEATGLYKAVGRCKDVVSLGMTQTGRLRVKSGNFKVFINCTEMEDMPHPVPTGEFIDFDGECLLDAFKKLEPFVGKDEFRLWTNGILLRGQSALATNNVCLVEYWLGVVLPFTANIPLPAVKEVLRLGVAPASLQMDANSITFHYEDGRWIKTQLYETEWPPLDTVLNAACTPVPIPETFFEGVKAVLGFSDAEGRIYFRDGSMCTSNIEGDGAVYAVEGLPSSGIYRAEMLALLAGVAEVADFGRYPDPVLFYGGKMRGAILGQTS